MNKQNLTNKFIALKNTILQKKRLLYLLAIGLLLLILIILLSIILAQPKQTNPLTIKYVLEDKLIEPAEPVGQDTFSVHRTTPDKWSADECDKLFTVPTGEVFTQIQLSNDQMVKTILKDAP